MGVTWSFEGCALSTSVERLHRRQQSKFDCGSACCRMVLAFVESKCELAIDALPQPCWTVDLYVFLRQCSVGSVMFTLVKGFDLQNQSLDWYGTHMNPVEVARCNEQFGICEEQGFEIGDANELNVSEIARRIAKGECAVVLIDDNVLKRDIEGRYAGHYIVLVTFVGGVFGYLDPASDAAVKTVSQEKLEKAWTSPGTDRDIIFVWVESTGRGD